MGRIERGGGGWAVSQSKTWLAWLLSLLRPLLKAAAAFFAPVEILRARWAEEEEEKGRKGPVPPSWAGQWLVPPSCLLWSLSLSLSLSRFGRSFAMVGEKVCFANKISPPLANFSPIFLLSSWL